VEFRDWLRAQKVPSEQASFEELRVWNARLFDAGWAAPAWPSEFGGRDASLEEQLEYNEAMAGVPRPVNAIGVANIAPAIMTYGTDEQKARFLRPMLRGDDIWSQGMSEPEAGSDLASLRCAAARDGDDFVVNGQKTWNSNGHFADWCQLYVRTDTDVPKHKGITCLLVDMRLDGIEARPITTMAGDQSFAELFFTDVRVPSSAMLGVLNDGWSVATRTLSNERAGVASLYLGERRKFEQLVAKIDHLSAVSRDQLVRRYIDVRLLEFLAKRSIGAALSGRPPGAEGSVIKLAWSQCDQALANTAVDVLGMHALSNAVGTSLLGSRSTTIAGGTTEVNKNIIGERVLGLAKEPS